MAQANAAASEDTEYVPTETDRELMEALRDIDGFDPVSVWFNELSGSVMTRTTEDIPPKVFVVADSHGYRACHSHAYDFLDRNTATIAFEQ